MRGARCVAALRAAVIWFAAVPAAAHPHVWITTETKFVAHQGAITGVRVGWTFDEMFSATLFEDFGKKFGPKEIAELEKTAFRRTEKQNYFTFVKVDGKLLSGLKATEFTASVDKGRVRYQFLLRFPKPVNPRETSISIIYYEDTYYIDVNPKTVGMEGDVSLTCKGTIAEDKNTTIYFGMVHPQMVTLHC